MARKLVYGVGLNDSATPTSTVENGKRIQHKTYQIWKEMLGRCYSNRLQSKYPSYIGCSVCHDWLKFSNFRIWMESQKWQGNQIDKDLIFTGNKVYSPETCVFISGALNAFLVVGPQSNGLPTGVSWDKQANKYVSHCRNPFSRKDENLGHFECKDMAHAAWRARKHQHAKTYATMQDDRRVADALMAKYA